MIETALTVRELEEALRAVEPGATPAAVLVPPRIIRRVIRHNHPETGGIIQVPHRKSYVCHGRQLLDIVAPWEIGLREGDAPPLYVILLPRPDEDALARLPRSASLIKYWRLLFHARVHVALARRIDEGKLTYDDVQRRIAGIGAVEFEEMRTVLKQERFLPLAADDRAAYVEFVAVYSELKYFLPGMLSIYFPGLVHAGRIDALLAEDVETESLFQASRLAGAPDQVAPVTDPGTAYDLSIAPVAPAPASVARITEAGFEAEMRRAASAAEKGNSVRAAILRKQAARDLPQRAAEAELAANAELDRLARRLQAALDFDDTERLAWQKMLAGLLEPASQGDWPAAARLLYDLQKICLDHERPIFSLALVDWALSLGRRPLQRPLPDLKLVRAHKRLSSALYRLTSAGLADADRRDTARTLNAALARSARRIRERVRPLIHQSLDEVALQPRNFPERISRDKLVEELLDRIVEVGYLTMSDLRDSLSRNQIKLPDLKPEELYCGDPLLLWNRRLAEALPGIYHPGEVYLRWLQKLSSVAFGTPPGRFLTKYLALPFGGAFVILEGMQHVVEPIARRLGTPPPVREPTPDSWEGLPDAPPAVTEAAHAHVHLMNRYTVTLLGLFLLLVMYVPAFRRTLLQALRGVYHGVRWCLFGLPAALLELAPVQTLLASWPIKVCWQFVIKPLLIALAVSPLFPLFGVGWNGWLAGTAILYVITAGLLHSRLGRDIEELSADWLVRTWEQISTDIVPGIFWFIVHLFKWIVEAIERLLYSVDEWLRFKTGDSRLALAFKAVFGTAWSVVRYVIRFCVNLLIEPQINPIKHFPVVTVSHKLVLTLGVPHMARVLAYTMNMDIAQAVGLATAVGTLIPGIFGFLVWELKENWKLYEANRARTLRPVVIGHHGETMVRFLRVGFHSGTLPKLFARLRKSRRRALKTNRWKSFRKQRDALHHVEESLHRFLEREFLALVQRSKSWGGAAIELAEINPATNHIRFEIRAGSVNNGEMAPLDIVLIECEGRLLVHVAGSAWREDLTEPQRRTLALALTGLFHLSGVQQVGDAPCDADEVRWQSWVEAWDRDQAGKEIDLTICGAAVPSMPSPEPTSGLSKLN